jgi:hypothetical protein
MRVCEGMCGKVEDQEELPLRQKVEYPLCVRERIYRRGRRARSVRIGTKQNGVLNLWRMTDEGRTDTSEDHQDRQF